MKTTTTTIMKPTTRKLLAAIAATAAAALAACEPAPGDGVDRRTAAISAAGGVVNNTPVDPTVPSGGGGGGSTTKNGMTCTCTQSYRSGRTAGVSSCDLIVGCPDLDLLHDCDGLSTGKCDLPTTCDCHCEGAEQVYQDHGPDDGVYLTGIPDLWQFAYGCDLGGANAVGCGPIAMSMMYYAFAERGYTHLTNPHLTAGGLQDWKDLTKTVRGYTSGACVPGLFVPGASGEFMVTEDEIARDLGAYPTDRGYEASSSHYRVCDGCGLDQPTDIGTSAGLTIIRGQLEAGRPVLIGLNINSATSSYVTTVDGDIVYTGDLAGPSVGWINHYALITASTRTKDGRDVLYLNTGTLQKDGTNVPADLIVQWKSNHKWTHLFTLSISGAPDGNAFCPIDDITTPMFSDGGKVDYSNQHQTGTTTGAADGHNHAFTAYSGVVQCGIALDTHTETFTPESDTSNRCPTLHDFAVIDQTSSDINVDANQYTGGNTPAWLYQ
jgi:hypothetical protein